MPFLLTESLDAARREETHQHIESCAVCSEEWSAYQDTWRMMDDLPEVAVPPMVKDRFLAAAGIAPQHVESNVVPFHRKPALKWIAQAAAVVLLAGSGYFFGVQNNTQAPAPMRGFREAAGVQVEPAGKYLSIAETRTVDSNALSPEIEGRPNINNVTFIDGDSSDDQIKVAFDITSRWTVSGNPRDKSMVRLLSYMLESEAGIAPRSNALDVVRRTYSDPANADPEIAHALAKVLRNDEHEGVRIRALDTLSDLPANVALPTRDALIEALKNDPNPAVRLKAVEALTNMAQSGAKLDADAVNTLRLKAAQDDENLYVRVKAAEALSKLKP